jgi:hypothetical protein
MACALNALGSISKPQTAASKVKRPKVAFIGIPFPNELDFQCLNFTKGNAQSRCLTSDGGALEGSVVDHSTSSTAS